MGSRVLLTGASGFLGRHIHSGLLSKEFEVLTLGRGSANSVVCDLTAQIPNLPAVDWIVHCAGQTPVQGKPSAAEQIAVRISHEKSTENLILAVQRKGFHPSGIVYISSVAVYGRDEGQLIDEREPLAGKSAYALGKIRSEQLLEEWHLSTGVPLVILRLPLIAGNNAKGSLGKMVNAIKTGRYVNIGGGKAQKSMVLADDVAGLIPLILGANGIYNLTDGYHPNFAELSAVMSHQLGVRPPRNMPMAVAKMMAVAGDIMQGAIPLNSDTLKKITATLTFDDTLARKVFAWTPHRVLEHYTIH